jgi:hypothetical protein
MTVDGAFYPQPSWEPRIGEIESGLWPTPMADDAKNTNRKPSPYTSLSRKVKTWPTPTVQMSKPDMHRQNRPQSGADDLGSLVRKMDGGDLNPRWVEWLMDMPEGWLSCKPLEMLKWHQWLQQHGLY